MNQQPTICLIGAGTMGGGMGRNLLKAGFSLIVFDLKTENVDSLIQHGASAGASAQDVVQKSDIILTSLPTSGTFVKVAESILPDPKDGKILMDMGTTEVPETKRLAALIRQQGADLVDAPVSGGGRGADDGNLAVMVQANSAKPLTRSPWASDWRHLQKPSSWVCKPDSTLKKFGTH